MKTQKFSLFIIIIISINVFLPSLIGIHWGRPENMSSLIFSSLEEKKVLLPYMMTSYSEIWEGKKFYEDKPKYYNEKKKIKIKTSKGEKNIPLYTISALRTFLLRSYGLDEEGPINVLSKMNPKKLKINPHMFGYGSLYFYSLGTFIYFFNTFGSLELKHSLLYYLENYRKLSQIYYIGRLFNLAVLILIIFTFFILAKEFFGEKKKAYISTLIFATFPPLSVWVHYVSPHLFGLLFCIISFILMVKLLKKKTSKKLYILTGFFLGITVGILNYYVFLILGFLYILLTNIYSSSPYKSRSFYIKNTIYFFIFFILGFLFTNPCILISFKEYLNEILWYRTYTTTISFSFYQYFFKTLRESLGLFLLLLSLLSLVLSIFYLDRKILLLLIIFFSYIVFYSLLLPNYLKYSFVLFPILSILIVNSFDKITSKLPNRFFNVSYSLCIGFILSWTLIYTLTYNYTMFKDPNVRTDAGLWVNSHIPKGVTIGLLQYPSPWRTPPFRFTNYSMKVLKEISKKRDNVKIPEYFIVSSIEFPKENLYKFKFFQKYYLLKNFSREIRLGKIIFLKEIETFDWMRPSPSIWIFKKY